MSIIAKHDSITLNRDFYDNDAIIIEKIIANKNRIMIDKQAVDHRITHNDLLNSHTLKFYSPSN